MEQLSWEESHRMQTRWMWYPSSSSFMNCGKCSNLRGRRYDMPYPCSVLTTPAWLHSRCLLLLLIFLSGSGDLSDTRAWKGLIKKRCCQRWPYRDATVWLMVSFTADKNARRLRPGRTVLRNHSEESARHSSNERNNPFYMCIILNCQEP